MIKVEAIDDKHIIKFISAIKNKKNPRKDKLLKIKRDVIKRYEIFCENKENLEKIGKTFINTSLPKDKCNEYSSLLHLYNNQESKVKDYLKDLKSRKGSICPYCGVSLCKQVDHFLPKDKYPEFSIFLPNLIVTCTDCNLDKKVQSIDEDKEIRFILNPYYDNIYNEDFIICKIKKPYQAIGFELEISEKIDEYFINILNNHLDKIGIRDKIKKQWASNYNIFRENIKQSFEMGRRFTDDLDKIKDIIKEDIPKWLEIEQIKINKIERAFYNAIYKEDDLILFLVKEFENNVKLRK